MAMEETKCDVCNGKGIIEYSALLPPLLRKHLGVLACASVGWCSSCRQLMQLWDEFSISARRNLALNNHSLIPMYSALKPKASKIQVICLDLDDNELDNEKSVPSDNFVTSAVRDITPKKRIPSKSTPIIDSTDTHNELNHITSVENGIQFVGIAETMAHSIIDETRSRDDPLVCPVLPIARDSEQSTDDPLSVDPLCIKSEPIDNDVGMEVLNILHQCNMCARKFSNPDILRIHQKYKHANIKSRSYQRILSKRKKGVTKLVCNYCCKSFRSDRNYEMHLQTHFPQITSNKSKFCDDKNMKTNVQLHKDTKCTRGIANNDINSSIFCPYCFQKFADNNERDTHIGECHPNDEPSSVQHTALHEHSKNNRRTSDGHVQYRVQKTYKLTTKINCNCCNLQFPNRGEYTTHFHSVHRRYSKTFKTSKRMQTNKKMQSKEEKKKRIRFTCEKCMATFVNKDLLSFHLKNPQCGTAKSKLCSQKLKKQKLQCSFCNVQFDCASQLVSHIQFQHSDFSDVGRQFYNESNQLNESKKLKNSPRKTNYVESSSSCTPPKNLVEKIPEKNSLETRFTRRDSKLYCNFCLKSYSRLSPMIKHINYMHLPNKSRLVHIDTTTPTKKYFNCSDCSEKFESQKLLVLHKQKHNNHLCNNNNNNNTSNEIGKTDIQCKLCKNYFLIHELKGHMKFHKRNDSHNNRETTNNLRSSPSKIKFINIKQSDTTTTNVLPIKKYECELCGKILLSKIAVQYHLLKSHLETVQA